MKLTAFERILIGMTACIMLFTPIVVCAEEAVTEGEELFVVDEPSFEDEYFDEEDLNEQIVEDLDELAEEFIEDVYDDSIEEITEGFDDSSLTFGAQNEITDETSLTAEDITGSWEGEYTGRGGNTLIWRHLKLEIEKCNADGAFSGIAYISPTEEHEASSYDENASYFFTGNVNFTDNSFYMVGTEWIKYPDVSDNHSMFPFSGYINKIKISGVVDNQSNMTFSLQKKNENDIKSTVNKNSKYSLYDIGFTWMEAKEYCEAIGGHLATITSQDEQDVITQLISNGTRKNYWIGGFRNSSYIWEWVTGEEFSYANWAPGQPDNNYEGALMLHTNDNPGTEVVEIIGHWNDLKKEGPYVHEDLFGTATFGFICEWDDGGDAYIEQGPEISEMTYLAMSDAAYKNLGQFKGEQTLGQLSEGQGIDFFRTITTEKIVNNSISASDNRSWAQVYQQCLSTWSVKDTYSSLNTGLYFVIFERKNTNQVVFAFRGSQALGTEAGFIDWGVDDLLLGLNDTMSPQMEEAVKYVKWYQSNNPTKHISATGHSLGGGLAILVANACNITAVGFDSAPTVDAGYYSMPGYLGEGFLGIDCWTYVDHMDQKCPVGNLEYGMKNYVQHKTLLSSANPFLYHERYSIVQYTDKYELSEPVKAYTFTENDMWRHSTGFLSTLTKLGFGGWLILGTSKDDQDYRVSGTNGKDVIYGGDGNDWLNGFSGNDTIIGGNGNDYMDGNSGNDTYIYFKGQGYDDIVDIQGNDVILLYGFNSDDVITVNNDSAYVSICVNGVSIIDIRMFRSSNPFNSFEVRLIDAAGNIAASEKIQNWNQWNYRSYRIACPVDVNVYDPNGILVATLEDGVETTRYEDFGNMYCVYNEDTQEYEKLLDIREDYSVVAVGNSAGNMTVSVTEIDENGTDQVYSASSIPVIEGQEYAIDAEQKKVSLGDQEVELLKEGLSPETENGSSENSGKTTGNTTQKSVSENTDKTTITKKPTIKKPAATKNKITVKWSHFKHTSKKTKKIWKGIKKVQIQCATDSSFKNIVKSTMVKKSKTKVAIKGLKKNTTYYVRIRYYDGTGYSNWSKVKKIKTKKK